MFRHALKQKAFSAARRGVPDLCIQPEVLGTVRYHGSLTAAFHRRRVPSQSRQSTYGRRGFTSLSSDTDTIYALSSAQGRAGIAVIRVSGPACRDVYKGLCPSRPFPKARHAVVRTLFEPRKAGEPDILDSTALVLSFPAPRTVTGEDVLEFHVHGGPATVKAVLSAIKKSSSGPVVRYAEPGEFTKRAFMNDRLDLAQVESLSDTLAAETQGQRRAAVRGSSGSLGRTYEAWRQQLLLARGEIEALIDFSEDQHFDESPAELLGNVKKLVEGILHSIHLHEMGSQRNELLRNGIRIALLGPPNVGKSSLMNLIVGREASIVSHEAGTTRDIVEASLDIRGYLCSFADTAGFRTKTPQATRNQEQVGRPIIGAVEEEGIRRAKQKALESDIIIALASIETAEDGRCQINYDAETLQLASAAQRCLIVVNKRDAVDEGALNLLMEDFRSTALRSIPALETAAPLAISCREADASAVGLKDPGGIHALISELAQSFSQMTTLPSDMQDLLGVTERQRQLLVECRTHLGEFMDEASMSVDDGGEPDIVLAAEHLRLAANCLARITGRGESGDVEEVLGVIFEKFCVGK